MTQKNILIIEDDTFLAHAYSLALGQAKYTVSTLYDGIEAEKYLKDHVPDLIVLDLLLPNKSGFDILAEFRKVNTKVPVLVASNLGTKEDIDRAMKLGATDYIVKSDVSITTVKQKVEELLQ